jgi:hypothetical protein
MSRKRSRDDERARAATGEDVEDQGWAGAGASGAGSQRVSTPVWFEPPAVATRFGALRHTQSLGEQFPARTRRQYPLVPVKHPTAAYNKLPPEAKEEFWKAVQALHDTPGEVLPLPRRWSDEPDTVAVKHHREWLLAVDKATGLPHRLRGPAFERVKGRTLTVTKRLGGVATVSVPPRTVWALRPASAMFRTAEPAAAAVDAYQKALAASLAASDTVRRQFCNAVNTDPTFLGRFRGLETTMTCRVPPVMGQFGGQCYIAAAVNALVLNFQFMVKVSQQAVAAWDPARVAAARGPVSEADTFGATVDKLFWSAAEDTDASGWTMRETAVVMQLLELQLCRDQVAGPRLPEEGGGVLHMLALMVRHLGFTAQLVDTTVVTSDQVQFDADVVILDGFRVDVPLMLPQYSCASATVEMCNVDGSLHAVTAYTSWSASGVVDSNYDVPQHVGPGFAGASTRQWELDLRRWSPGVMDVSFVYVRHVAVTPADGAGAVPAPAAVPLIVPYAPAYEQEEALLTLLSYTQNLSPELWATPTMAAAQTVTAATTGPVAPAVLDQYLVQLTAWGLPFSMNGVARPQDLLVFTPLELPLRERVAVPSGYTAVMVLVEVPPNWWSVKAIPVWHEVTGRRTQTLDTVLRELATACPYRAYVVSVHLQRLRDNDIDAALRAAVTHTLATQDKTRPLFAANKFSNTTQYFRVLNGDTEAH